jgi:HPt (histidine-containing phosphotransfer) domain-containing protein
MGMTAATDRLEQAIAGLRERFLRGLPARLDVIDAALHTSALTEVERGFHSLAGTAGTYGLVGIAAVAAEGECACMAGLDESTQRRITELLDRLRTISRSWEPLPAGIALGQGSVCTS